MNVLSSKLGLGDRLEWVDVYSLTEPSLLEMIPRPVLALLVIIPLTPIWKSNRETEDADKGEYQGKGEAEPVVWFKQTIGNACGSIGLLHCLINGPAKQFVKEGSIAAKLREGAVPLGMKERAQMLYDSEEFEHAHQSVAELGDTVPGLNGGVPLGQHFVSFVVENGELWELEGDRKGPISRGKVPEGEDVLGETAMRLGLGGIIQREIDGGGSDLRFSCIALVKKE